MTEPRFAPYAPGWLADPYDQYRELRSNDPVHWSEELGHWILTRNRDVAAVLKDTRFTAANRPPQRRRDRPTTMVTSDPPQHTRLRKPLAHSFLASTVEELRPRVEAVVDELLDAAEPAGRLDVVLDLARPLPRTIISELMGVPNQLNGEPPATPAAEGHEGEAMQPSPAPQPRPMAQLSTGVVMPAERFFQDALEQHRKELADDLLNDLLAAEAGHQMTPEEVLDTATILYGAGQETTAKMIANGVYHLLKRPDQFQKLRDDPALIATATEELLRFDSPVHAISRRALEDVALDGGTIRARQKVLCVLAAANRDPDAFEDPDRLDIQRHPNPHVTFGAGIHTCLGSTLARLEVQTAVRALVSRYPNLRLATDDIEWEGSFIIRGVKRLPVVLG